MKKPFYDRGKRYKWYWLICIVFTVVQFLSDGIVNLEYQSNGS
jgi:hypothetical protein